MIPVSDAAAVVLRQGSFDYHLRAWITLDGAVIADNVPIIDGQEEYDSSLTVPERVTVAVPRYSNGFDWQPNAQTDPLAAFGQRLHISLGIGLGGDQVEWFDRGEFLIQDSDVQDDRINVTAVGLLALIDEAKLVSPFQPRGTLASSLRALVEPALTVSIDPALVDRAVPAGLNYDDDRLATVNELLDAWPASAVVSPDGYLVVTPPDPTPAYFSLLAKNRPELPQYRATIIRQQGGSTRDGVYNTVVARGTAADGGQIQGVAYDNSARASAYGGPFNPLAVPYFYASPLLTTVGQCNAAAKTVLARVLKQTYGRWDLECPPIPIIVAGDGINILSPIPGNDSDLLCSIDSYVLPYRATAPMTMTLRKRPT